MVSGHFAPGTGDKHKVFRIENDQLLNTLGLEERSGLRYSFAEFSEKILGLKETVAKANAVDPKQRDLFQRKLLKNRSSAATKSPLAPLGNCS